MKKRDKNEMMTFIGGLICHRVRVGFDSWWCSLKTHKVVTNDLKMEISDA